MTAPGTDGTFPDSSLFLALGVALSFGVLAIYVYTKAVPASPKNKGNLGAESERAHLYVPLAVLNDIEGGVNTIAFTQGSQLLLIGTGGGKILVWSTTEKNFVSTFSVNKKSVDAISVSSDGGLLVSAGGEDSIKLWNLSTETPEAVLPERAYGLAFSPTADLVAVGVYNGLALYSIERQGRSMISLLRTLASSTTHYPRAVAFRPDGTAVAMAGQLDDGKTTIQVWNTTDMNPAAKLVAPTNVNDISLSRTGLLAAGGDDKSVRVWDIQQPRLVRTLASHSAPVTAVAFGPDGDVIATGVEGQEVDLWNVATGRLLESVGKVDNRVEPLAFSPDNGRLLVAGVYKTVLIWIRSDDR